MSLNFTTKDQDTPNRSAQGGIIVLPIFTPKASSTRRPTLAETLRLAHPLVNMSAVSDMLYESIFGETPTGLRISLKIPQTSSLNRALKAHSYIKYHFLLVSRETLRIAIENLIEEKSGDVSLSEINKHVSFVAIAFKSYVDRVDEYIVPAVEEDDFF